MTGLWAGLALAAATGGFLKGAIGFGGALVLAPAFVFLVGPRETAVLVVLIHALTCLQGVGGWHPVVRWKPVAALSFAAVAFTALCSHFLGLVDVAVARRITGCVVMALALLQISGWRWRHKGGAGPVLLIGLFSGICTATSGAGGPPAVIYLAGISSGKESLRGNLLAYFVLLYTLTAGTLAMEGQVSGDLAVKSLILAPLFYFGGIFGEKLFLRMEGHHFDRFVAAALVVSGAVILFS